LQTIKSIAELEELYGHPAPASINKVAQKITPHYKTWIDHSSFVILATASQEGTDASPRGDQSRVVSIIDESTLWIPDWKGNNRLDTLRNIITDGRISLLFMIAGCNNVVRVNGNALLSVDRTTIDYFEKASAKPKSVIVINVHEVYFQCAKSLMRSKLWETDIDNVSIPTAGDFLKEADSTFNADAYDQGYAEYAKRRMW